MNQQRLPGRGPSLLQRTIATITGAVVLTGLFIVGLFASVVLAGIAVIGAVVFSIWIWRQRRLFMRLREQHESRLREAMRSSGNTTADDSVIEGEFEVRSRHRERR